MTRANIYIGAEFIGELGGDAYPVAKEDAYYPNSFWRLMESLDGNCDAQTFREQVQAYILDRYGDDYLPPKSEGVSNWTYEYEFTPEGHIEVCHVNLIGERITLAQMYARKITGVEIEEED